MSERPVIRDASEADGEACAAIYVPYVTETAITFETEPPTDAEMARRIAAAQRAHAWLVLVEDGRVVGYAYGGPFKERAAYAAVVVLAVGGPCTTRCWRGWPSGDSGPRSPG